MGSVSIAAQLPLRDFKVRAHAQTSEFPMLVITDSSPQAWIDRVCMVSRVNLVVEVLPLGISRDHYRASHGILLERLGKWKFAETAQASEQARQLIRECVPQFMVELRNRQFGAEGSLLDQFQHDGFNAWWFLEVSEKSAYRGLLINRLFYLALVRSIINATLCRKVYLCLADTVLSQSLANGLSRLNVDCVKVEVEGRVASPGALSWLSVHLKNALGVGIFQVLQQLMVRGLRISNSQLPPSQSVLLFSFYPRMWSFPYSEEASEWFFGHFPKFLPAQQPAYYSIWLTAWPWEIWKRRRELRSFFRHQKAFFLMRFVGLRAIAGLLHPKWWLLHFRLSNVQGRSKSLYFASFDVGNMVYEELHRSLSSSEFFHDLLLVRAWRSLSKSLLVTAVLYRLEFQPFENAILYGIAGRARTVAFQHSSFGRNYLPYHFVPGELGFPRHAGSMPLADLVVMSGEFGREVMLKNGYRSEAVEVCGPLRYRKLLSRVSQLSDRSAEACKRLGVNRTTKILVVATSVSRQDAEGLLAALQECAAVLGGAMIMFRSHPALPLEKEFLEAARSCAGLSQSRVLGSVEELYDALLLANAAVVNNSTVAFEALVLGVAPVIFDSGSVFDPKAMESDEWAGMIASNAEQLGLVLRSTMEGGEELVAKRRQLIEQAKTWFDQPEKDPYLRFLNLLEKHGILSGLSNSGVEGRL